MYNDRQIKRSGLPAHQKSLYPQSRSHKVEGTPLIKTLLLSSVIGVMISAVAGFILLCVICFIAVRADDPLTLVTPLSLLVLLPSNFLGGLISSKKTGEAPLACGIVTAAMWGAVSLVLSLCLVGVQSSNYALWQNILLHALSAIFCVLGAFAGSYKPRRTKKRFGR